MKPPAFDYSRPESLGEALRLLADLGPDGKVLAGGQSLLPILSMRLAAPRHLIDINRVGELDYVSTDPSGVRVGALARHSRVLRDEAASQVQPLLAAAVRLVAHPTIRNRGTTVGSVVHADPSAELPAVLTLLDGSVRLASEQGERTVAAADFFLGPLQSDVRIGELAIEIFLPARPRQTGVAIAEVSRRNGDYAVCGVAGMVDLDDDLRVRRARTTYFSVGGVPVVLDLSEVVAGRTFDAAMADVAEFVSAKLESEDDIHATAAYRLHLAGVLTHRVVIEAARSAAGVLDG